MDPADRVSLVQGAMPNVAQVWIRTPEDPSTPFLVESVTDSSLPGIHAVFGAGRPLGTAVVQRLRTVGERARAVVFDQSQVSNRFDPSVETVVADPTNSQSVERACRGATVIYNCFEPPLSRWRELTTKVNSDLLLIAINGRAALVMVSRLFNSEGENQSMEAEALEAYRTGVGKAVVAQIPQPYGPGLVGGAIPDVFDAVIKGEKAYWPGPLDVRRSMVYSLDAADALVGLARNEFAYGRTWSVAGPGPLTGRQFTETAFRAAEKTPQIGSGPRGPVAKVLGAHRGTPYDYEVEFVLDGSAFSLAFPGFSFTPHDTAIAATLEWYRDRIELRQKLST
jgi:nucleoside-diphosphate-sugar epimerase